MKPITALTKGVGIVALVVATNSWGYTISGGVTNVGSLDALIGISQLPNSGQQTETDWVNSLLNPDTTFTTKTETVSYSLVDGQTSIYTFALQSDPGWYIVKNATWSALFQNAASVDWAVFDDNLLPGGMNLGGTGELTISHVSEFGGSTSVPEPSSLTLLVAGLLGLVATRRLVNQTA